MACNIIIAQLGLICSKMLVSLATPVAPQIRRPKDDVHDGR